PRHSIARMRTGCGPAAIRGAGGAAGTAGAAEVHSEHAPVGVSPTVFSAHLVLLRVSTLAEETTHAQGTKSLLAHGSQDARPRPHACTWSSRRSAAQRMRRSVRRALGL